MLKALARWILRHEAPATQEGHIDASDLEAKIRRLVAREFERTQEEVQAQIKKLSDQIEWELGEWYEKFSTLHARTAKRAQREGKPVNGAPDAKAQPLPSVLHFRKPWSP